MTNPANTDRRPFSHREASRHTETRVRIGERADGTACEHPYPSDEPSGYIQWQDWAMRKAKTHKQQRCPDCGLWTIYVPKGLTAAQRDLLVRINAAEYGELYLKGADLRAVVHPIMRPLVDVLERGARLTPEGREAIGV